MSRQFREFDIVMYQKGYGITRNWFGYVVENTENGFVLIKWWDNNLKYWGSAQQISTTDLHLIGRVDG